MTNFNKLDFINTEKLEDLTFILQKHGCEIALIKKLTKNNNDKNQIYFHHDASILNSLFDMTFTERGESSSLTKKLSTPGKFIPQALFNKFYWLSIEDTLHQAKNCKAIVYHQYPEARLSGFLTVDNEMPRSMSIEYTKENPSSVRYLLIGATSTGKAIAIMLVDPSKVFERQFQKLPFYSSSKICRHIDLNHKTISNTEKLKKILIEKVADKTLKGCRYNKQGETIPFTGTQVHGYTLEHACGIKPNSNKNGDIFGIELKCFTNKKLTLFTPEPDGGLYFINFAKFMTTYGYLKGGDYRFTGLHRINKISERAQLTLKISYLPINKSEKLTERKMYSPDVSFSKQMNDMRVELEDVNGQIAASWSIERLLNCWGAKHNEVVYYPATVTKNTNIEEYNAGYEKQVCFSNTVLWCKGTSLELLIQSISNGTVFLDPAPKYNEDDKSRNKRRSQWRTNNIYKSVDSLYKISEEISLL